MLIGSLPFIGAFIIGLIFRRMWIAVVIGLAVSAVMTFYSAANPEAFRFGRVAFNIHNNLHLTEYPIFATNLVKNLFFAYAGALSGFSFREGYLTKVE